MDRAIRIDGGAAHVAATAGRLSARSASTGSDFLCARCGAVVCESARMRLFSGMVLRCIGCGESNRVPR